MNFKLIPILTLFFLIFTSKGISQSDSLDSRFAININPSLFVASISHNLNDFKLLNIRNKPSYSISSEVVYLISTDSSLKNNIIETYLGIGFMLQNISREIPHSDSSINYENQNNNLFFLSCHSKFNKHLSVSMYFSIIFSKIHSQNSNMSNIYNTYSETDINVFLKCNYDILREKKYDLGLNMIFFLGLPSLNYEYYYTFGINYSYKFN